MSLFGKTIREVPFRKTAFMPRAVAMLLLFAAAAQGADRPLFDTALRPDLLTAEEKAWLEAHPNIRVAVTKKYEPVEFFDDVNGGYWGITSEYFNLIENRIGRRFEYINPSPEQWAQLDPAARGADVVTASAETPERTKYWSYTRTYLSLPTYLIARHAAKDDLTLRDLKGGRVAVVRNWAAEEYLRTNFPGIQIDAVPDASTGLRKASFGLVDAFVSELPVATEWMEKEAIANLKIAGEAGYTYDLGISVRKDWPELLGIFEKALATITPAEREAIYKRWVKIQTPPPNERLKRIAWWGGSGLLALLAGTVVWNRALASRVRARTAALHSSEERFSKAFHHSPDAMFISRHADGVTLEANLGAARMFGGTREEFLGGGASDDGWGYLSPEVRERVLALVGRQGGSVRDFEARMRRKNGELFTGLVSYEQIEIGGQQCLISITRDVTELRRMEAEAAQSRALLEAAFEASPAGAVIAETPGKITLANSAAMQMFGSITGDPVPDGCGFFRNDGSRYALNDLPASRAIASGVASRNEEIVIRTPDGRETTVLGSGAPVRNPAGEIVAGVAIYLDITERKRTEAGRQQLLAQLFESEDEERRRIARELHDSTAQHLAAIQMNLTRLRDAAPAGTDAQLLADSLSLTAQSVQEIRTLSYLLHPPMLDELGLGGALTDYAAGFAKRSGITVDVDGAGYSGRLPRAQELALFRVAQESLANIHRHSGGTAALVRLERDAGEVRLEVQDNGCGLPTEVRHGVGLRGMRERVSQIGGELSIESDAEGTTVLASVPVTGASEAG